VWESSGRSPVGLVGSDHLIAMGLFDECLAVRTSSSDRFRGQYCTAFFYPSLDSSTFEMSVYPTAYAFPQIGICLPSSCSPSDFREAVVQMVANFIESQGLVNISIGTAADHNYCYVEKDDPVRFDGSDIAVL